MDAISLINRINIYVRRALDDTMPINWQLERRRIFDYEILYIKNGNARIMINNKLYIAKKGDLFLFKPNVYHSIECFSNEKLRQPHIHFDFMYDEYSPKIFIPLFSHENYSGNKQFIRKDITKKNQLNLKEYYDVSANPKIESLIFNIIALQNSFYHYDLLKKNACMYQLISLLCKMSISSEKSNMLSINDDFFDKISIIIENNYNKKLDLNEIAKSIGYSKNYLVDMYKEHFGYTPTAYHDTVRKDKAISYVLQQNITITEIAYTLGFDSIHEFSRFFKRMTNFSPLHYRQNHITQKR